MRNLLTAEQFLSLSPTRLDTAACPYRFRALYALGVKEESAPELLIGREVHTAAAVYVTDLRDTRRQTDMENLDGLIETVWVLRDSRIPDALRDDFEALCRRLLDWLPDPETIVGSELRLSFDSDWKAADWDAAAWRGVLDVFQIVGTGPDRVAIIRDWTAGALGGAIEAKKDLQLRFYGLLAFHAYGIARAEVTMHSLRTGATKTITLDEDDHDRTAARITAERDRIAGWLEEPEMDWPAVPGTLCGICRLDCPAVAAAAGASVPVRLDTPEQARTLLHQIVILDEQRKRLMKPLRAYAAAVGAVADNGMEAAFRPSVSRSYPMEQVAAMAPVEVLSLDRRKLLKIRDRDLVQRIEALATVRTAERFSVAKQKAAGEAEEGEGEE